MRSPEHEISRGIKKDNPKYIQSLENGQLDDMFTLLGFYYTALITLPLLLQIIKSLLLIFQNFKLQNAFCFHPIKSAIVYLVLWTMIHFTEGLWAHNWTLGKIPIAVILILMFQSIHRKNFPSETINPKMTQPPSTAVHAWVVTEQPLYAGTDYSPGSIKGRI